MFNTIYTYKKNWLTSIYVKYIINIHQSLNIFTWPRGEVSKRCEDEDAAKTSLEAGNLI